MFVLATILNLSLACLFGVSQATAGDKAAAGYSDSIHVEVKGTLRTGIVAIGGETTGTTISAKDITWELDFGGNPDLQALAEKLNGKTVVARGSLDRKKGIEIRQRWIVAVCEIEPAGQDRGETSLEIHPGTQEARELNRDVRIVLDYLLYLPKDYDRKDSWPLMLFLHGAGERGDDLELVKKHGPPKLVEQGKQFPFIVVSPQCPKGRWWQTQELSALVDEIVGKYGVDEDRIYVTGLSMGGFGTWALAAYTPNRFAAIAPICGGGEAYWTKDFAHVPTWAFHGGKDSLVPPERSERMVAALNKHGGEAKLTVYPKAAHDSWTETYANPEFYEWLLQQKRTAASKE